MVGKFSQQNSNNSSEKEINTIKNKLGKLVIADIAGLETALKYKSGTDHNHDHRYFKKEEINNRFSELSVSKIIGLENALKGRADKKHTHSWNEITEKPTLFSGDYNDLINKPVIPTSSGGNNISMTVFDPPEFLQENAGKRHVFTKKENYDTYFDITELKTGQCIDFIITHGGCHFNFTQKSEEKMIINAFYSNRIYDSNPLYNNHFYVDYKCLGTILKTTEEILVFLDCPFYVY